MQMNVRNVEEAYHWGLWWLYKYGQDEESRNGPVRVYPEPFITKYERPMERVLFNPGRDANPFFHLMEALWMLQGRNDVRFLATFNKRMLDFSDDGTTLAAAYGHRWVRYFHVNQLSQIVSGLGSDPKSRRAVLAMWEVGDLFRTSKDIPCNTHCYFRIRQGELDLTVCCRSNDIIWGAYGANSVHFSVLLEYVAKALKLKVGQMYQVSNNWHAYTDLFWKKWKLRETTSLPIHYGSLIEVSPIVTDYWSFLNELDMVMRWVEYSAPAINNRGLAVELRNPFLYNVVNMARVWHLYKSGDKLTALSETSHITASDWRLACQQWIQRRIIANG